MKDIEDSKERERKRMWGAREKGKVDESKHVFVSASLFVAEAPGNPRILQSDWQQTTTNNIGAV